MTSERLNARWRHFSEAQRAAPEAKRASYASSVTDIEPVPPWGWIFIAVCGLTVILTDTPMTMIQGLIGVAGAGACWVAVRDTSKTALQRLLVCLGVTAVTWLFYVAILVSRFATS